ncbi:acyl-CoA dehydrogenase [Streptomyces xanthophaeus]|uniref:acyl-CoA dehydrogenase n=1 Tax=Streptomyces xanthophaeus TaxID=67385 RepID=UPI002647BE21|nr:acyl-CoA dehydrogenase [Streptomyces xanthophaeus]WKD32126.1 acyl-CoA dehydrogenase [Streptomyces xanthophaeus]
MSARRTETLEEAFGDAWDPANPLGHRAILAADERSEPFAAGERVLDAYGLNAEFVPTGLGGRLDRLDRLARTLRPVFRRDASMGVGYGVTGFIAGVGVWAEGTPEQQRRVADILLSGRRMAAAHTELAHGSDMGRNALRAEPAADGGLLLTGGKQMINNLGRADAAIMLARTGDAPGSRSHSLVLAGLDGARAGLRHRPRLTTSALRGSQMGAADFDGLAVPPGSIVGRPGHGLEGIMRAFQVTRSVLPGMMLGTLDTELRCALSFALERRLYGRRVGDLPHARSVLAGALADMLVCDSIATVAARALHVVPAQGSVLSGLAKYLVADLAQGVSQRLAVLLGARSFLRDGPYGIFQKMMRDLPVVSIAHAGGVVCRASVIPQLPSLARNGWRTPGPSPDALFLLDGDLPPLDLGRLELTARGADHVLSVLTAEPVPGTPAELADLCAAFAGELKRMADVQIAPRDRVVTAGPEAFALAARYAAVLGAAACVGVWRANRRTGDPLTADPAWVVLALHRLAVRIGLPVAATPAGVTEAVFDRLVRRRAQHRSFDLYGDPLAGQPPHLPAEPSHPGVMTP